MSYDLVVTKHIDFKPCSIISPNSSFRTKVRKQFAYFRSDECVIYSRSAIDAQFLLRVLGK